MQTMQTTFTFKHLDMKLVVLLDQLTESGVFSVGRCVQILYSRVKVVKVVISQ